MLQVWPESVELIPSQAYSIEVQPDRAFLRLNMVSSIDGNISVKGRSKALSSEIDRECFHAMRALSDVILVGASTMKTEKYGPVIFSDEIIEQRIDRGQQPQSPIALVSGSADFDWQLPFFINAISKPIVFTTYLRAQELEDKREKAEIIGIGEKSLNLAKIKPHLVNFGLPHILCEGGPTLNAGLLGAGAVDELCLTISPKIIQGQGKRIFDGDQLDVPADFELTSLFVSEGQLFTRYSR